MFSIIKYFVITIVVSLMTALYLLCMTPSGLQYELQWLAKLLPGKLMIEKINGTLLYGFTLQNISYQTPEQYTTIKSLTLRFKPDALLQKKLVIEELLLDDAKIKLISTDSPNKPFHLEDFSFLRYISLNHISLHHVLIEKSKLSLQLNGDITHQWNVKWEARIPELSEIQPEYTGSLTACGTISGLRSTPTIHTVIQGKQLNLNGQKINKLHGQTDIIVKPNTTSSMQLTAFDVNLHDYFFKKLEFDITGNVAYENNKLTALLNMNIGRISIPLLGIHPEKIALQATLDGNKMVILSGHLQSGKGTANMTGTLDLNHADLPLDLTVQGSHLQAVNLSEYKIIISPDLTINFTYPLLQVTGKVLIPDAKITPKDFSETQTLPNEVVFVNQAKPAPTFSLNTLLQIHLNLGENVSIQYDKLQTQLSGEILITKDADSPAIASGELYTVDGTYTAYGKKLAIETGRLI